MTTNNHIDCKHWLLASCSEYNNPIMTKFKFVESAEPEYYYTSKDINELNKLCKNCPNYESFK